VFPVPWSRDKNKCASIPELNNLYYSNKWKAASIPQITACFSRDSNNNWKRAIPSTLALVTSLTIWTTITEKVHELDKRIINWTIIPEKVYKLQRLHTQQSAQAQLKVYKRKRLSTTWTPIRRVPQLPTWSQISEILIVVSIAITGVPWWNVIGSRVISIIQSNREQVTYNLN
jgi:hypothetical protein